jgi:hypothetical protein
MKYSTSLVVISLLFAGSALAKKKLSKVTSNTNTDTERHYEKDSNGNSFYYDSDGNYFWFGKDGSSKYESADGQYVWNSSGEGNKVETYYNQYGYDQFFNDGKHYTETYG